MSSFARSEARHLIWLVVGADEDVTWRWLPALFVGDAVIHKVGNLRSQRRCLARALLNVAECCWTLQAQVALWNRLWQQWALRSGVLVAINAPLLRCAKTSFKLVLNAAFQRSRCMCVNWWMFWSKWNRVTTSEKLICAGSRALGSFYAGQQLCSESSKSEVSSLSSLR